MDLRVKNEEWKWAAVAASNLSELLLILGQMEQAVSTARQGVDFADRSEDGFERVTKRARLAAVLHQAVALDEAEKLFREAEAMQQQLDPGHYYLYSLQGYLFCDLLLSRGQVPEVLERFSRFVEWRLASDYLLDTALENLSAGRAHFLQARTKQRVSKKALEQAEHYLKQAVAGLREAGIQHNLPWGLFARAALYRVQENFAKAWGDLSEAQEIAERGEMRLHLADFHLEASRLHLAQHKAGDSFESESAGANTISPQPENHLAAAKGHLKTAKKMINEIGYHRRDPEVEELQLQIANYK